MNDQFHFKKSTDNSRINPLVDAWRSILTAPQDGMWEAFANMATQYELFMGDELIGYSSVDDDNRMLQFYIAPQWLDHGPDSLDQFISEQDIKTAIIGSNNPVCLSLAMHSQKSVTIDTYLFQDAIDVIPEDREGTLRLAQQDDLDNLIDFCHVSMGGPKEWLEGYLGNLIQNQEIHIYEIDGEILGTCEVRKSASQPDIADVGMVVSLQHRKKGIGTFLLGKAKEIAKSQDKQAICSCEKDNIGSLKSIHKNGFRSFHQMLLIEF